MSSPEQSVAPMILSGRGIGQNLSASHHLSSLPSAHCPLLLLSSSHHPADLPSSASEPTLSQKPLSARGSQGSPWAPRCCPRPRTRATSAGTQSSHSCQPSCPSPSPQRTPPPQHHPHQRPEAQPSL